jgi:hypothetical protein
MQSTDFNLLKRIAGKIKNKPNDWLALSVLNNPDCSNWDSALYKILRNNSLVDIEYNKQVAFIKILSHNWNYTIPQLLMNFDWIHSTNPELLATKLDLDDFERYILCN